MLIKLFKKHPKALPFLFLTEMWERFGFYVVQGLLVLYMTKLYHFSDDDSYTILGVFTSLAYMSPMLGGLLADRFFGFKTAIIWGAVFLIAGYALLAMPFVHNFYLALATIIIGNGLFKPNISSLLGVLYKPYDSLRDAGFTIFYIGINAGVLLAGLSSGYIKDHFGWHASFAVASIGLLIGLSTFAIGMKKGLIHYTHHTLLKKQIIFLSKPFLIVYCLMSIPLLSELMKSNLFGNRVMPALGIFLLIFVFSVAYKQQPADRKKLIALNVLIISSIIFWMIYWQMFFSVNLFIDRLIDKNVLGHAIPTTAFYSLESISIILFGPAFAWSWQTLDQYNRNPSYFMKFVLAILFVGFAFLILAIGTHFVNTDHLVSPLWIVLSYIMITIGEMLLSPIGLAAVTMLAPKQLTGMMMGIWFVALGFGGAFAGILAKFSSIPENAKDNLSQLPIYRAAFMDYFYLALGVAVVLFILQWIFKQKVNDPHDPLALG